MAGSKRLQWVGLVCCPIINTWCSSLASTKVITCEKEKKFIHCTGYKLTFGYRHYSSQANSGEDVE